jgi:TonB family protein
MRGSRLLVLAAASIVAALSQRIIAENKSATSADDDLRTGQLAWGSNPAKRCPELHQSTAEEGAVAVVKFMVGPTGAPSQASIRSSSGSAEFDAAALGCVAKLHFLPATRYGDGTAVASWQQFALKWTGAVSVPQHARCEGAGTAQDSTQTPTVVTEPREVSAAERDQPGPSKAKAGVCVCVDETGKITDAPVLTNSSGIPGFDKAALELSAATRYRPATATNGKPAAGCFRFKVGIEAK